MFTLLTSQLLDMSTSSRILEVSKPRLVNFASAKRTRKVIPYTAATDHHISRNMLSLQKLYFSEMSFPPHLKPQDNNQILPKETPPPQQ
jgi:hypothetical protein